MRAIFLSFPALALFASLAHAENAITFSPALPKPWAQISSQVVPGTNAVSQTPITANITVVQNTTNLQSMMISVIPLASPEATNHLADDARNWLQSILNGIHESHVVQVTQFEPKSGKKQQVVGAAFTLQLQDTMLCGISRYSIVKTNAIAWVAFGPDPSIESNKVVMGIAASIRVRSMPR
jgi:hypothetical protein